LYLIGIIVFEVIAFLIYLGLYYYNKQDLRFKWGFLEANGILTLIVLIILFGYQIGLLLHLPQ